MWSLLLVSFSYYYFFVCMGKRVEKFSSPNYKKMKKILIQILVFLSIEKVPSRPFFFYSLTTHRVQLTTWRGKKKRNFKKSKQNENIKRRNFISSQCDWEGCIRKSDWQRAHLLSLIWRSYKCTEGWTDSVANCFLKAGTRTRHTHTAAKTKHAKKKFRWKKILEVGNKWEIFFVSSQLSSRWKKNIIGKKIKQLKFRGKKDE